MNGFALYGRYVMASIRMQLAYPASFAMLSLGSFLVTIVVNVLVADRDNRTLYEHNDYVFHEQFETTSDLTSFIEEDSPAVQRLSRGFAQALVSDILESF